jgi:large subunit ribosomal protein L33
MAGKGNRVIVTLECTEARGLGESPSRYTTTKNKKTHPKRMEKMKYNWFIRRHTLHRETKR